MARDTVHMASIEKLELELQAVTKLLSHEEAC